MIVFDASTDFFTSQSLGTFAGASTATVVVSNTLRKLLRRNWILIPFLVALALSCVAAAVTKAFGSALDVVVVLINGCLLFCTALGLEETIVDVTTPRETGAPKAQAAGPVPWLSSWIRH
jgi:hypothetical protein